MVLELVRLLIEKKLHITTAESCTAGMISSKIVDIPDASKVLNEAYIVYSNEAKNRVLGVSIDTINKYDVVSENVAYEMALGAHKITGADISISTTGNAGPSGNPIGRVCFGFYILGSVYTLTKEFGDIGRNNVRNVATDFAIKTCLELLKEKYND